MKPILFAMALSLAAAPALAQNASQIGSARNGASCPGCNLFQADFGGAQMAGRNFSRARLRQADLSLSVMNRARFTGADMRDVEAYGGVFSSADFTGANLTHASFVGAFLEGANFSGATLDGTNFSGAEMSRAVGLTPARLSRACGDEATVLPRGLSIPRC
jgi:uncharacterized protein YjbI with pentapeptide repeats